MNNGQPDETDEPKLALTPSQLHLKSAQELRDKNLFPKDPEELPVNQEENDS